MKNQFSYKRKVQKTPVEGETTPVFEDVTDSFDMNMVLRTSSIGDGKRLVILNDFHEETRPAPIYNKARKITGFRNEKNTYQSEIVLEANDAKRYEEQAFV